MMPYAYPTGTRLTLLVIGIMIFSVNLIAKPAIDKTSSSQIPDSTHQIQINGPLRVNPANRRYFTDGSGKAVYLTGSHTWANFQDIGFSNPPPVFDYNAYLDFLQANNHNFFRLWAWEQAKGAPWADNIWVVPLPYQRSGFDAALDGEPKFDLAQFEQAYFDRMRNRIIQAGNRGIYVSVMLFDGWSVGSKNPGDTGSPWTGHPFNAGNNVNGINGDPNGDGNGYESQTLSIAAVTAVQDAYVRKVIDTVNDLDNVLYEICNECNQDSTVWQYHMIDLIHQYEATKPKQHPVGMTVAYPNGSNMDLFNSPADWVSPNDYSDPPASDGVKVILADTDHIWGIGGDRQWVWKSFTRGINPIFMDCYNPNYCEGADSNNPEWVSVRLNMGYTLAYAERILLMEMTPRNELCSSKYCLASPPGEDAEYLVYLPDGGGVSVDLSGSPIELWVEWFDPQSGDTMNAQNIVGGGVQAFNAPFSGDAVLYIHAVDLPAPVETGTAPFSTPMPTSAPPSQTPSPPNRSLPCASGFLALGGMLLMTIRSGQSRRKSGTTCQ